MIEKLSEAKEYLISRGITNASTGLVLGTGLHHLITLMDVIDIIPYTSIPGFPVSTVESHKGNLVYGTIGQHFILVMQGRLHAYEGYSLQEIVFPVRVMRLLGIQRLFLTNAAGGVNLNYKKGDLILIEDHINLQSGNPLTGKNLDELGGRFPDMSEPYNSGLNAAVIHEAEESGIKVKKGVYAAVNGPNLETKAEYRYLKVIGADLVGMSTVPEVIAASHMQLPCAAISVVTDECDPDNLKPININEIIEVAGKADKILSKLLYNTIRSL